MFSKSLLAAVLALGQLSHAVPAPQASSVATTVTTITSLASTASMASISSMMNATSSTSYFYVGPSFTALAQTVSPLPASPTGYPRTGNLTAVEPVPFAPAGGMGTNGSLPNYIPASDFDFESLSLALYQEYIELDLFHHGLAMFSDDEFAAAGLSAEDRFLIEFMADQEVGHAELITNMLGAHAPVACNYTYPFTTVREFIDFCQKLTRWGESGVYGFLPHLNSGPAAQLLLQSISTEARQQMIFRQFEGLFPMPVWFEVGIPQSWAWTLLAPYVTSCPANQTRLFWANFPALTIENNPNPYLIVQNTSLVNATTNNTCGTACNPGITHNRTALSTPGQPVYLNWESPGKSVGPNGSYTTNTSATGPAAYALWVSQLNATYTPLMNISGNSALTMQPNMSTFKGDPMVNGTIFVALTDQIVPVSPFNLSNINPYVVAGPAVYQAG